MAITLTQNFSVSQELLLGFSDIPTNYRWIVQPYNSGVWIVTKRKKISCRRRSFVPVSFHYFSALEIRCQFVFFPKENYIFEMQRKISRSHPFKFFKGCLPQNLFSPPLNTLPHIKLINNKNQCQCPKHQAIFISSIYSIIN